MRSKPCALLSMPCASGADTMDILIIQTAFIGDVILATPLVEGASLISPGASVSVLVRPEAAGVFKGNPYVGRVITYDKRGTERGIGGFSRILGRLRKGRFDIAIVPHRSLRSALLAFLSEAPVRVGFENSAAPFLFTETVSYRRGLHEAGRNLELLTPFGVRPGDACPRLYPGSDDISAAGRFLRGNRIEGVRPLIAIAPGSVWPTKRWPAENYAELARRLVDELGAGVVIVGGKGDVKLSEAVAGMCRRERVAVAAGRMGIPESAAFLSMCDLLVSNDSAPVHMASAVGTPVVAIFGPTVPEFGFAPCGDRSLVLGIDLPCRPCGVHGGRRCPEGHFRCMVGISPDEVFKAAVSLLKHSA